MGWVSYTYVDIPYIGMFVFATQSAWDIKKFGFIFEQELNGMNDAYIAGMI